MSSLVTKIKLAFTLSAILGVMPWYNSKKQVFSTNKVYPVFIISLILLIYILSTIVRIQYMLEGRLTGLDVFLPFLAVLVNLNNIIRAATCHINKIQMFIKIYDKIYNNLQKNCVIKVEDVKYFNIKFSCGYFIIFIFMISDITIFYIPDVLTLNLSKISDHINLNGLYLFTLLHTSILIRMVKLYKGMNSILKSVHKDFQVVNLSKRFGDEVWVKIETVLDIHYNLGDLVDITNECFGWHCMGYLTIYIFACLDTIQHLLQGSKLEDLLYSASWILFGTVQALVVTVMCERIVGEGRKCIDHSYNLTYKFSKTHVKEKLFSLCQQTTNRCPEFNAAGFHSINYAILFTYLNLLTTYVIVLIQFSSQE